MNYKGKNKILITAVLCVTLLAGGVAFVIADPGFSHFQLILLVVVVILAAAALGFSVYSVNKIEKRISRMPDRYKSAYHDALEAVGAGIASRQDRKEVMEMILEIFEHAALEGRNPDEVTGGDMKSFIDGFLDTSDSRYTPAYFILFGTMNYFIFLLAVKSFLMLKNGGFNTAGLENADINSAILILYGFVAYAFIPWMMISSRKAASEGWKGVKRLFILLPFFIPVVLVSVMLAAAKTDWMTKFDRPLNIIATPESFVITVIMAAVCGILLKIGKRKSRNTDP